VNVLVIGAGGHAKVVIDAIECAGDTVAGVVDECGRTGELCGYSIISPGQIPPADGFVIAIGGNRLRRERFDHYVDAGLVPVAVVHPAAVIGQGVTIGAGSVVFAGVVVNRDAAVGDNAILNTGCTVDHDCIVGAHVHIAPGVNVCGGVRIGEGTLVGVGSAVVPGASIGAWSTIGAGAAVIDDIPDGVTVVGVPACEPSRL